MTWDPVSSFVRTTNFAWISMPPVSIKMIWQVILWEPKWPWMMHVRKCLKIETELLGAFTIYWIVANVIMESWMITSISSLPGGTQLSSGVVYLVELSTTPETVGASQFDPRFFSLGKRWKIWSLSQNEGLLKSIVWFLRRTRFHLPFCRCFLFAVWKFWSKNLWPSDLVIMTLVIEKPTHLIVTTILTVVFLLLIIVLSVPSCQWPTSWQIMRKTTYQLVQYLVHQE